LEIILFKSYFHNNEILFIFQWRKEIIRFYSDRISLKYLKIKLEHFLLFAVKLYDLKITYIRKVYCSGNPKEYSSHVISGSKTTRRARSPDGLKLVWGCLLTDGDFTKWRQAMAHTPGLNPVACYVSFETRAFEIYATLPAGPRTFIYQMIRSNS